MKHNFSSFTTNLTYLEYALRKLSLTITQEVDEFKQLNHETEQK
ncbi:hypothetical protein [Paenibacillus sp. JJ-100]|nr:hypothetical protein [Paenibacillus sp. JJ-100]